MYPPDGAAAGLPALTSDALPVAGPGLVDGGQRAGASGVGGPDVDVVLLDAGTEDTDTTAGTYRTETAEQARTRVLARLASPLSQRSHSFARSALELALRSWEWDATIGDARHHVSVAGPSLRVNPHWAAGVSVTMLEAKILTVVSLAAVR